MESESEFSGHKLLCRQDFHNKIQPLDAQAMMTISTESEFSAVYYIITKGAIHFHGFLEFKNSREDIQYLELIKISTTQESMGGMKIV